MSEYTPGPWCVKRAGDGFEFDVMTENGDGYYIAAIPDMPGQTEANARLIAAAPDLLRAVRLLLSCGPHTPANEWDEVAAIAKKAWADAEGRAP